VSLELFSVAMLLLASVEARTELLIL